MLGCAIEVEVIREGELELIVLRVSDGLEAFLVVRGWAVLSVIACIFACFLNCSSDYRHRLLA